MHAYLRMVFDFRTEGNLIVDIIKYAGKMVEEFKAKHDLHGTTKVIAKENVLAASEGNLLNKEIKEEFHIFIAKGLFTSKRGRPDFQTVVLAMTTRVKELRTSDWKKATSVYEIYRAYSEGCVDFEHG